MMADQPETLEQENERLKRALRGIITGGRNGEAQFKERIGSRSRPTWYAVNILQDHLAACIGFAEATLEGSR